MNCKRKRAPAVRLVVTAAGLLATYPMAIAADVSDARISTEGPSGENWFLNGGNFAGQHYSPLDQIDGDNIATLGLAWATVVDAADGIAGTPIVVDDVIYLSAAYSIVYALDASSGRQIWRFDPQLRARLFANPDMSWTARANRGVAVYAGKVFVATADCMLLAIDASRGKEVWSVETCDTDLGYAVTDAPRVGGGKVFIGNAGSESGQKNRGYVSAYNADDGELLWRFYTVPSSDHAENTSAAIRFYVLQQARLLKE
ncbi:MAG: PQQ-binding-like beta-propeller repeat protein [Gammaproteobacteria bacterium]|nr:PQQ-binding-like beta-propeller repeat protein [Gammaproteobacteria bacterium]